MTVSLTDSLLLGSGGSLVRAAVVLDTKAVINSACHHVRHGCSGRLDQAILLCHLGLVPLFAPHHVIEEVDEHLAERALQEGHDPVAVTHVWNQQLRPHIRVVDLEIRDHLDPRLRGVLATDPDDLSTAALALLLAPAVVFTDDADLVDNGFASRAWWTEAAGDVLIIAMADGQVLGAIIGVGTTITGIGYGTVAVVHAVRRAPLVTITVAVVVLTGAWLLLRRSRPGRGRASFKELGTAAGTAWREMQESRQAAAARLPWVPIPTGRAPTLEERCARILARITGTLSAAEVHEQLRRDTAHPAPSVAEVRAALRGHRAFVQVGRGRWQLGVPAGTPQGPS
jgi:hypothetical protein